MQNVASFVRLTGGGRKGRWRYADSDLFLRYLKVHIENSLRFWEAEQIVIGTNFAFEYMGVRTHVIQSDVRNWSSFSNKLLIVAELIDRGVIAEPFWYHDLDAFQLQPFEFPIESGVGFTRHTIRRRKLQGGSSFYAPDSFDFPRVMSEGMEIFRAKKEESFFYNLLLPHPAKEVKMKRLRKRYSPECVEYAEKHFWGYTDRLRMLDWTWNLFRVRDFTEKYQQAEKPIKVCHFHPEIPACAECFVYGMNKHGVRVVDDTLKEIMQKHRLLWPWTE